MKSCRSETAIATTILFFFLLTLCLRSSLANPPSANITLSTLDGKITSPLKSGKGKPCVVIFITTDCPIANALVPEINRIYAHYKTHGIQFTLVQVDPELSLDDAKQHAKEYSLQAPVVIDRKHQLVKAGKASLTPQCAVFNSKGKLVYTGRLNNQWADYGKRRVKATEQNLRDTLDALLAGKPAPKSRAPAIGCYIPDLD